MLRGYMRDPQLLYNQICHQLEQKLCSLLLFLLVLTHALHPDLIQINLKYLSDKSLQSQQSREAQTKFRCTFLK